MHLFVLLVFIYIQRESSSIQTSSDKIKARHFHSTKGFIDCLCTINDGGEFGRPVFDIYPKELDLKGEHQGDHATFLNLDTTIKEGTFIYKIFDKRDSFPFSFVRIPHIESNIPHNIFYSAIKGEFLRIACSTLCLMDFIPKAKELLEHMKQQGSKHGNTSTFLRKIILAHSESFQHCSVSCQDLLNFFPEDKLYDFSLTHYSPVLLFYTP